MLVEKVLFRQQQDAEGDWVATGVKYYEGHDLYEASASYDPQAELGQPQELHVAREVILAGGAYSTPQMLMLSGIGDHEYFEKHRITDARPEGSLAGCRPEPARPI